MGMTWVNLSNAVQQIYNQYRYEFNNFTSVVPVEDGIVFNVKGYDGFLKYFYSSERILKWCGSTQNGYWDEEG